MTHVARRAHENALWQRALIAAIPFAMTQSTWTRDKAPINGCEDRVKLAADVADSVVLEAFNRGRT